MSSDSERNTLSMRLLRYSNVPVAAYEASTLSIEQFITISKLAILKDIYNVARTEQAAIACSRELLSPVSVGTRESDVTSI